MSWRESITIKPTEIRVGDTIRVTSVTTGTVDGIDGTQVRIKVMRGDGFRDTFVIPIRESDDGHAKAWELILPPMRFGSLWQDPESGSGWVVTFDGRLLCCAGSPGVIGCGIGDLAPIDGGLARRLVHWPDAA